MTVDNIQNQILNQMEKTPMSVQNEIQKEVLQQTMGTNPDSPQKQLLQMIASSQPQQAQQTAQEQIKNGKPLDIRI